MSDGQKVVRMRRTRGWNVGVLIFVIIFLYVAFQMYGYLTKEVVAEYEVGQGTIATNHVFRALAVRDETVVYAGQSGYINYYMKNASKASVNDVVYSIDTTGEISKKIATAASDGSALGAEATAAVARELDQFCTTYDSNHFSSVEAFCVNLNSGLSQTLSTNALHGLQSMVASAEEQNTFCQRKSDDTGIIVYYTDGYENVTVESFVPDLMNSTGYERKVLDVREQVSVGEAVYKRIGSEEWNLILAVSENMAKQLSEMRSVRIRFCKDDYALTVPFSVLKIQGDYFLNLTLQTAMIRYVNDRFIEVELVLSEEQGLKIPNTAITSKEFYTVPKAYFSVGGDSSSPGLLIQDKSGGGGTVQLVTPTIYYEENDLCYIDDESVQAGDVVIMSDSALTYTIGQDVASLTGVYNINKGYAVFKQIRVLSQNESYAIVEMGQPYGISLYDHIALEGSKLREDQLVVK